jgi:hypothetical protein
LQGHVGEDQDTEEVHAGEGGGEGCVVDVRDGADLVFGGVCGAGEGFLEVEYPDLGRLVNTWPEISRERDDYGQVLLTMAVTIVSAVLRREIRKVRSRQRRIVHFWRRFEALPY